MKDEISYKTMLFRRAKELLFYDDITSEVYFRLISLIKGDDEFQALAETLIQEYERIYVAGITREEYNKLFDMLASKDSELNELGELIVKEKEKLIK